VNPPIAATATTWWRRVAATLLGEQVVSHNLIVATGTVIAGVLGVAFQGLFSHNLRPGDYGGVFAVVTLIGFIGLPAGAFTLLMARQASRDRVVGQVTASGTLLRQANWAILLLGTAIAAAMVFGSPPLSVVLNVPGELLIAAAVGVPFALALPLLLGEFQGEQRFLAFTGLLVSQAGLKLIGALVLGALWGPAGIIAGISLASALVYLTALSILRSKMTTTAALSWWRPALKYLAVIVPSTLSLSALLSADVLIVKHYFPTQAAGEYSAVAALGRAIFWGASGVAAVLFPKVVSRDALGRSGSSIVAASLFLVALGGVGGFGLLWLSAGWLLSAFSGPAYSDAAGYLPLYAVGMTLLGAVAVLIATQQSRGTPGFLAILCPLTLMEPAALLLFHQTLSQVVQVIDVCMALVLVGLGTQYLVQERRALAAGATSDGEASTPAAAQLALTR